MIKFTKNQTLILETFFNNVEKSYYLHEIGRIIGKKPGVFQRDINKLVKEKILEDYYKGNNHFFRLNQKHPLFKEIKSIFFKTSGIEGSLKKVIKKVKGIKRAFLYGSFARGKENTTSDIDLFVIGSINENDLIDPVSKLEKKLNREINYVLMTEKEFEKKKGNNSFVKSVLSNKIIELT